MGYPATHSPAEITRDMCRIASISQHDSVLEPSAGSGGMVEIIQEFSKNISAVELNESLVADLHTKGCRQVLKADFLRLQPGISSEGKKSLGTDLFDVVIMCPPKESDAHIMHASKFLKPHGRLVALVQEQNINPDLWKTYRRIDELFYMGGKNIPCGLITIGC